MCPELGGGQGAAASDGIAGFGPIHNAAGVATDVVDSGVLELVIGVDAGLAGEVGAIHDDLVGWEE